MVRHPAPGMHGGQGARQMAVPGHRQGGSRDPQHQRQQRAQRRQRRPHPHHGRQPGHTGRPHRIRQRGRRRGQAARAQHRQRGHRHRRVHEQGDPQCERHRPRDRPLRVAHLLAQGGDPRIPRECEEQQPGRLEQPRPADLAPTSPEVPGVGGRRGQAGHDDPRQHRQHRRHDHPGDPGGLLNAPVVRGGQRHHRRDGHRMLLPRPHVRPDGQRHRRARGGLADHEAPAGQVAPERAEPLPPVHVRPARGRIAGGQPRRGVRVAVGDAGRQGQGGEQRAARRSRCAGRGGERGEDPGPDHGPEPDDDGVEDSQRALQFIGHAAEGSRRG